MALISVRAYVVGDTDRRERSVWMWCPGCDDLHRIVLDGPSAWEWNGSEDAPTFTPSILVQGGPRGIVCHSFVVDGVWQFLGDCTHALAGRHVPMVHLPADWLRMGGAGP